MYDKMEQISSISIFKHWNLFAYDIDIKLFNYQNTYTCTNLLLKIQTYTNLPYSILNPPRRIKSHDKRQFWFDRPERERNKNNERERNGVGVGKENVFSPAPRSLSCARLTIKKENGCGQTTTNWKFLIFVRKIIHELVHKRALWLIQMLFL